MGLGRAPRSKKGESMQKFVVDNGSDSDTINAWYRVCQKEQLPYIVVEKRTKFATVRWDYISFNSENEKNIVKNQDSYIEELNAIFAKYRNAKSEFRIDGAGLIYFFDIEVSKANAMAEELYDIVEKIAA